MGIDPELAGRAYNEIRREMRANVVDGRAVTDPETYDDPAAAWYIRPPDEPAWDHYLSQLEAAGSPALAELDSETTEIVKLIADPKTPGSRRKGLVMGNVQSGKTRSFAGVAAKAADAGYKLVIVLAGMHDNLRDQTQARLDTQLFDGDVWYSVTHVGRDFEEINGPEQVLSRMTVVVAVVKKNVHRLDRLVGTLGRVSQQARRKLPVLIVDDEADQATPNSLTQRDSVSAINRRVRDLWHLVETGTYLAYTATPFANVLIDPDEAGDLFPSDFITTIPPGDGYFGAERVFGISETVDEQGNGVDGLDMVRTIPDSESTALRPPSGREAREAFDPAPPDTLLAAFRWFVVATAIRRARDQSGHSSMLVHTTHYTAPHSAMRDRLERLRAEALDEVRLGRLDAFEGSWSEEATRVADEATVSLPAWEEVAQHLEEVLDSVDVIMDNGTSEDRLNYDGDGPRTVIAVGGGTLSRGLTLEGLVVSYFTRTSNTYDTLLQMGRWFGYRPGYEDLPRVWVAEGLDEDYAFLARVEQDLRAEIESVQGSEFTPAQVGLRVRAHPGRLEVTAANKMWSAEVVQLGLSETSSQTFILSSSDTEDNVRTLNQLLAEAHLEELHAQGRWIARDVEGSRVERFLKCFQVHDDQRWLADPENRRNLRQWVTANAKGPVWNVLLAGNSRDQAPDGTTTLGTLHIAGRELKCLNRAPLVHSTKDRLDFKAIASPNDRIADIDPNTIDGEPSSNDAQRRRIRRAHAAGQGLVVIYPISAHSKATRPPADAPPRRMDMPGDEHVLGFSIFFPSVNDETGDEGTFVSVRRRWDVPDVAEGDEDEQDDLEEEE